MFLSFKFFLFFLVIIKVYAEKTCDEIPYCSKLRYLTPEHRYTPSNPVLLSDDIIELTLYSNVGLENLLLQITTLEDSTFRLKIEEIHSKRYELVDVLEENLKNNIYDKILEEEEYIILKSKDNHLKILKSPFLIEFYKEDQLQVILNGDQLLLGDDKLCQAFSLSVEFPEAIQTYGLFEHVERLALQSTVELCEPYHLNNVGYGSYDDNSTAATSASIPVLYGHGHTTAGIFLHNAAEQWIDIENTYNGTKAHFIVESGTLDLFVLLGPKPKDVVLQYLTLTGVSHLPQIWSLGYHQSRQSYATQEIVTEVALKLDECHFTYDSIWLDVDYTDDQKFFTWNPKTFPEPIILQEIIEAEKRKLVIVVNPHVKVDVFYKVYIEALEEQVLTKNYDGTEFEASHLGTLTSFLDFLNPKAIEFYVKQFSYKNFLKTTPTIGGVYNDLNEPTISDIKGKTLPKDLLHHDYVEHIDVHNLYGLLHSKATYEGLLGRDYELTRPFVVSKSVFAGSQRYAAHATSRTFSDWESLKYSSPACLTANLLGIVFCGSDIGGSIGNPDKELLIRWYQLSAWQTLFRAHASEKSKNREPYLYDKEVQKDIREAIHIRYKHLPVWYTLFYEHTIEKQPIVRPLFYEYPDDENVLEIDNHLLLGSDILVRPVLGPNLKLIRVYFPGGDEQLWISESECKAYKGVGFTEIDVNIHSIPYYYRSGSIVVRKDKVRKNTADMAYDGYTLYIVPDKKGKAKTTLYIDDGLSFEYKEKNKYNYIEISAEHGKVCLKSVNEYEKLFPIKLEKVVYLTATGILDYVEKIVYEKDVKGNLLCELDLDLNDEVTLELK